MFLRVGGCRNPAFFVIISDIHCRPRFFIDFILIYVDVLAILDFLFCSLFSMVFRVAASTAFFHTHFSRAKKTHTLTAVLKFLVIFRFSLESNFLIFLIFYYFFLKIFLKSMIFRIPKWKFPQRNGKKTLEAIT